GASGEGSAIVGYLANVLGMLVFVKKAALGVFVQIWLRWTLPRLRIDQVMTTCLKYLVPISCFLFFGCCGVAAAAGVRDAAFDVDTGGTGCAGSG
ncbi:NADH-quinone oxidoreductase subunit H, partial [Planctomyces bekefii]